MNIVKKYDYRDTRGNIIFQILRTDKKDFFQGRPCNGFFAYGRNEGWYEQREPLGSYSLIKNCSNDKSAPPSANAVWLETVEPVLYHLPEIIEAIKQGQPIFICEGEKDADNLASWGYATTTCAMGAGKWKNNYTDSIKDAQEVIILPDKDEVGRNHAFDITNKLAPQGIKLKIIELPDINNTAVKDISDWIEAGGQKSDFEEIIQNTPYYEPPLEKETVSEEIESTGDLKELINLYGEPYYINDKRIVYAINECFWAGTYNHEHILLFEPNEKAFYIYNPETGLRETLSIDQIKQEISSRILEVSREQEIPSLELKRYNTCLTHIVTQLKGISEKQNAFDKENKKFVHLANGIIVFNDTNEADFVSFSPDFYSRNQCPIPYDKDAKCPRFLNELLLPAVSASDSTIIQKYFGLCLLGRNLIQRFLILDGESGRGKSQLSLIIQHLIGRANFTELRTKHLSERFELYRYLKKTLLVGVDVPGNFLSEKGAHVIKGLVGGDWFDAEQKGGTGNFPIQGKFCVVITSNSRLQIRLYSDAGAWRRRLLIVRFECPPPIKKIPDFADLLIKEEGSGILNWALHGLAMIFNDINKYGDIHLEDNQKSIVEALLSESDSIRHFLNDRVIKDAPSTLTTQEIIDAYSEYCAEKQWNPKPPTVIPKELEKYMLELFSTPKSGSIPRNGKDHKGYRKVRLKDVGHQ